MATQSRRQFIVALASTTTVFAASRRALARSMANRSLSFTHTHTGERLAVEYFSGGDHRPEAPPTVKNFLSARSATGQDLEANLNAAEIVLVERGRRSVGAQRIRHTRELHLERRPHRSTTAELEASEHVVTGHSLVEIF